MSNTYAFLSWDADKLSDKVDKDIVHDNPENLKQIAKDVERGVTIMRAWLERADGELLFAHGDEGWGKVPGQRLEELVDIHRQMQAAWKDNIVIGVGLDLNEAKIAMNVAKKRGGGRILFYTDELKDEEGKDEEKKLGLPTDELTEGELGKATPEDAPPSPQSPAGGDAPAQQSPQSAVQSAPEHSQDEGIVNYDNQNMPSPPSGSLADEFHGLATTGEAQAAQAQAQAQAAETQDNTAELKQQIAQILMKVKEQAPVLEQLKQQAPDAYQAVTGVVQAMIAMARQLMDQGQEQGPDEQGKHKEEPAKKSEIPLDNMPNSPLKKALNALRGAVMGAALGAASMTPAQADPTWDKHWENAPSQNVPDSPYAAQAEPLHPHLKAISFLESSNGKYMDHADSGHGAYWTAHGELGFKPATAHDEYKRNPELQRRFPGLQDPTSFTSNFKTFPAIYNGVANSYWNKLLTKFKDPRRAAYAWRFGEGAALKDRAGAYRGHEYVRRFHEQASPPRVAMAKAERALVPVKIITGDHTEVSGHLPQEHAEHVPTMELIGGYDSPNEIGARPIFGEGGWGQIGAQRAAFIRKDGTVLKLQGHYSREGADQHLRKVRRLRQLGLSHVVPIVDAGYFGVPTKVGSRNYSHNNHYTYEVIKKLHPINGSADVRRNKMDEIANKTWGHMDAHPGNIMEDTEGNPRLIDLEAVNGPRGQEMATSPNFTPAKKNEEDLAKVAPPGFPHEAMMKLKSKYGVESAFKIAWAAHNKKHKKVEIDPNAPQIPGRLAKQPMEKAGLPMPESGVPASGATHRNIPAGNLVTQHTGKREVPKWKVIHTNANGKTSTTDRETMAGMVLPQNPQEALRGQRHPVSALNPHDEKQSGGDA